MSGSGLWRRGGLRPAILAPLLLASTAMGQPRCDLPQPFPACGTTDVRVNKGESMTLPAGPYGVVRVRNGGTLVLSGGDYFLCGLHVSRNSVLFESPATINVTGEVKISNATFVGP